MDFKKLTFSTVLISGIIFNNSFSSSKKQDKDFLVENSLRFEKKSFVFKMNPYENLYFTDNFILIPTIEENFPIYVIGKDIQRNFKVKTGNYKNIEEVLELNGKIYIFGDYFIKNRLIRCLFKIDKENRNSEKVYCDTNYKLLKRFGIPYRKSGLPKFYPYKEKNILILIRNGLVFLGFYLQRPKYEYQDGIISLVDKNKEILWKIKLDKSFRPDYFYYQDGIFSVKDKSLVKINGKGKVEKIKENVRFFTKISKDKSFSHFYTDRLKINGDKKFVYLINENRFYPLPKSYCKIFNNFCVSKDYFYNFKTKKVFKNPVKKKPFCMIKDYFVFQTNILKTKGLYVNKSETVFKFYDINKNRFVGYLKFKAKKDIKEAYFCWKDSLIRELKNSNRNIEFYKLKN